MPPTDKEWCERLVSYAISINKSVVRFDAMPCHAVLDEGGIYNSMARYLSRYHRRPEDNVRNCARLLKEFATKHYFVEGNKRIEAQNKA